MKKTVYQVRKGKKVLATYETYDEAAGFLQFLVYIKPFEFKYNIKEKIKYVLKKMNKL